MATLYITEYVHAAVDQGRALPVGGGAPVAQQTLNIGGGSVASAAFNANTHLIRAHTDNVCSVLVGNPGTTPIATQTMCRMAANQTEYFGVDPGGKIAVIANT